MAPDKYRQGRANLKACADETSSYQENGDAGDHGGEAALEHARGHEGEQHCQPAAGDLGAQNAPIRLNEGVAFCLQQDDGCAGNAQEHVLELITTT